MYKLSKRQLCEAIRSMNDESLLQFLRNIREQKRSIGLRKAMVASLNGTNYAMPTFTQDELASSTKEY